MYKFISIEARKELGVISRRMFPLTGACHYCGMSWEIVKSHSTDYDEYGSGMFPLCEDCWSSLTITERLPFYKELFDSWKSESKEDKLNGVLWADIWNGIEKAVLNNE